MRRYFTLLTRESKNAKWAIEFGDYDRQTVADERDSLRDSSEKRIHTLIIQTTDEQSDIEATVRGINGKKIESHDAEWFAKAEKEGC